jgi:hypothetical protein
VKSFNPKIILGKITIKGKNQMCEWEGRTKTFMVKSTPQIINILDNTFDLDGCQDRSVLIHKILLPYVKDIIASDATEITNPEPLYEEINEIFTEYINSNSAQ